MNDENESIPFSVFKGWIAAYGEEIHRLKKEITKLEMESEKAAQRIIELESQKSESKPDRKTT